MHKHGALQLQIILKHGTMKLWYVGMAFHLPTPINNPVYPLEKGVRNLTHSSDAYILFVHSSVARRGFTGQL